MSKKANKTAIGAFVVGAVLLLITGVLVFGSGTFFKKTSTYVLFFDGSVKGLSVGAPVMFRGVKIGTVKDISLVYDSATGDVLIPVIIEVEPGRVKDAPKRLGYSSFGLLVERGLRARLEIQSLLTGQLMLSFDFHPDKPVKLRGMMKEYSELPTLPISPDIFEIMEELPLKEISDDLEEAVKGINKLVSPEGLYVLKNALQELTQASRSLRLFAEYLEQHPEAFLKGKPALKGE